jgi:hypothetical protein
MGLALYPTFVAAGLPAPELRLECWVGGGGNGTWAWANAMRGVLPLMERFGIATAADLAPETLADRLQAELRAANGIVILPPRSMTITNESFGGFSQTNVCSSVDSLKEDSSLCDCDHALSRIGQLHNQHGYSNGAQRPIRLSEHHGVSQ